MTPMLSTWTLFTDPSDVHVNPVNDFDVMDMSTVHWPQCSQCEDRAPFWPPSPSWWRRWPDDWGHRKDFRFHCRARQGNPKAVRKAWCLDSAACTNTNQQRLGSIARNTPSAVALSCVASVIVQRPVFHPTLCGTWALQRSPSLLSLLFVRVDCLHKEAEEREDEKRGEGGGGRTRTRKPTE